MKRSVIRPEKCKNCTPCLIDAHCPNRAVIREDAGDKPWIDFYKCNGCMKCAGFCKNGAVEETSQPCTGAARQGW